MKPVDEITITLVKDGKSYGHRCRWTRAMGMSMNTTLERQTVEFVRQFVKRLRADNYPELA